MNNPPTPTPDDDPERVPLTRLAAQRAGNGSPALTRILDNSVHPQGRGQAVAAAFQSSV